MVVNVQDAGRRGDGGMLDSALARHEHVDALTFSKSVQAGRQHLRSNEPLAAACALAHALSCWRGQPGEGLGPVGRPLAALLNDLGDQRLAAVEDLASARLLLGEASCVAAEMGTHTIRYPLRERAWELLMRARYLGGDSAGALDAFDTARRALADDLGIDPGPDLHHLRLAILRRDCEHVRDPQQAVRFGA